MLFKSLPFFNYTHSEKPRYALRDHLPKRSFCESIKVVSYNIEYSLRISQVIELFKQTPQIYEADIFCLQEMTPEAVQEIALKLRYNYVYYPAVYHPKIKNDFGNAVLSKWPIIHDQKVILPKISHEKMQRIAVGATIDFGVHKLLVFSVHTKMLITPSQWPVPINALLNHIPSASPYCLIAGDFNTFFKKSTDTVVNLLAQANFEWVHDQSSWTYRYRHFFNKKSYLDHIFVRGLTARNFGHILNFKPSDHLPLWAELRWRHQ